MNDCLITFRSVTPAQRAERLVRRSGFPCVLGRTPKWMEEQGCGYSLRLRHQDANAVAQLLRNNQIAFRKIYLQRSSGAVEELTL